MGARLTFTVPSEEALIMWCPSGVKVASFTKDECPRNSFRVFPDFSPKILDANRKRDKKEHASVKTFAQNKVSIYSARLFKGHDAK